MLYSYSTTSQTVATNGNVVLQSDDIQTGCTVTHEVNNANILLNRKGFYKVDFMANILASTTGTTSTIANLQLFLNNVAISGAIISESVNSTDTDNVSLSAIVKVKPNCCSMTDNVPAILNIKNIGTGSIIVSSANISVTKLC